MPTPLHGYSTIPAIAILPEETTPLSPSIPAAAPKRWTLYPSLIVLFVGISSIFLLLGLISPSFPVLVPLFGSRPPMRSPDNAHVHTIGEVEDHNKFEARMFGAEVPEHNPPQALTDNAHNEQSQFQMSFAGWKGPEEIYDSYVALDEDEDAFFGEEGTDHFGHSRQNYDHDHDHHTAIRGGGIVHHEGTLYFHNPKEKHQESFEVSFHCYNFTAGIDGNVAVFLTELRGAYNEVIDDWNRWFDHKEREIRSQFIEEWKERDVVEKHQEDNEEPLSF